MSSGRPSLGGRNAATEVLAGRRARNPVRPAQSSRAPGSFTTPSGEQVVFDPSVDSGVDWSKSEPGFRELVDELRRLLRRGRQRMGIVVFALLVATSLLVFRQATKVRNYPARIVLSLTENPRVEQAPITTSTDLRNYINFGVLTDTRLKEILQRHHYRQSALELNARGVIETFREEVDIDVFKNEFAVPRYGSQESRSALVSIELWLPDPEQALAIVRDLGSLVVQRDEETRTERVRIQRNEARALEAVARHDHEKLQRDQAQTVVELSEAQGLRRGQLMVDLSTLERAITASKGRLDDAERARRSLDFQSAASAESIAAHWERVDWGSAAIKIDERITVLVNGVLGVLLLLPLIVLTVGAFNRRLYDERDVAYLGFNSLGSVRTRPGAILKAARAR